MQVTINLEPAFNATSQVILMIVEEIILTFHVGRARFMDDMSLVYAICYVVFWVGLWTLLVCGTVYGIWRLLARVLRHIWKWIGKLRAQRYVSTLESLPKPNQCADNEPSKSKLNVHGLNIYGDPIGEPVRFAGEVPPGAQKATILLAAQSVKDKVKEMAMATSTFFPSENKFTSAEGVMSVRSGETVIGMASCIGYSTFGPCLVTAAHVWAELWKCGQPLLEHGGMTFPVSFEWRIVLDSGPHDLDVVIVAVPHSVFAAIGVKKLNTKTLRDSQKCVTYGYNEHGYFGTSTGRLEHKPHEAFRCNHYATTTFGFSGSPLIVAGSVAGIHTGAELGVLGACNLGTLCFWLESRQLETPKKGEPGYRIEFELPGKAERVVRFNTIGKQHSLEQLGRSIKLRFKPMDFNTPLSFEYVSQRWDDEDDYEVDWEKYKPVKGKERQVEVAEPSSSKEDFLKEERSPLTKPNPMDNLPPGWTPDMFLSSLATILKNIQDSPSSSTSQDSKSAKKKSRKRTKALQTALASNLLGDAPTESLETITATLPASTRPLRIGQISQSGKLPNEELPQNEEASSSKPVVSDVLVVRFTRRQEKLYNRVCQTRKYQQLWRSCGDEDKISLRHKLLEFVMSSKINLRETQVQAFLAQFSLEIIPV